LLLSADSERTTNPQLSLNSSSVSKNSFLFSFLRSVVQSMSGLGSSPTSIFALLQSSSLPAQSGLPAHLLHGRKPASPTSQSKSGSVNAGSAGSASVDNNNNNNNNNNSRSPTPGRRSSFSQQSNNDLDLPFSLSLNDDPNDMPFSMEDE
jgi:hypothetical protein